MKTKEKVSVKELFSFDIFDTLITRKCATPKGIFAFMQEKLFDVEYLPLDLRENFYKIRVESEIQARNDYYEKHQSREILFDEIYEKMQKDYSLENNSIDFLKKLEIETELENLVGIQENINKIKALINDGKRVILISDMYHTAETIRSFLSHIDPIFNDIKIYVSSEYRASKWNGDFYKKIKEIERIEPKNWSHFGDNKISDVKKAKQLGIKSFLYDFPQLEPYEEELLAIYSEATDFQKIVGTAKLTRCFGQVKKHKEKYDFGASLAGPFLYNYIENILSEAIKKEYKTLHFVARDGYIPKIVADIIIKKRGLDIKTKYLYGSRLAWRVPCEENYEKFVDIMFDEYLNKLSLEFLAYRFCVNESDLITLTNFKSSKAIFSDEEREQLRKDFKENIKIKSLILDSNKNRKNLLLDYIKQEIDLSQNDVVFVDISGTGRTQDFLSDYINIIKECTIHTFFMTTSTIDKPLGNSIKYTYCTEPKPHYHFLELLYRSLDGQTIGYRKEGDIVKPIFENFFKETMVAWGFNEYLQGIIDFINNLMSYKTIKNNTQLCYIYFDYITIKCSPKTATILGDIPFITIGNESSIKKVAPEIPLYKIFFNFLIGKRLYEISEFPFISLARGNKCTNSIKDFLMKCQIAPNLLIELLLLVELYKHKNEKIMFWGASIFLENFIKRYKIKSSNILGIIDKNPNRQGGKIGFYNIFSPDEIKNIKPDLIILTIKNRHQSIHRELTCFIGKNYPKIKLLPDLFIN